MVLDLARFSFNMFTYSNMNGTCLKGVYVSNPMNEINQSKLNRSMSYMFSSNPNNYTFKKLDNMLINMPENDGKHVLMRETVDGVHQYSWTIPSECFVIINNATLFEHTHTSTQPFNNQCQFELSSGLYLIITSISCYNENYALFKHCDSIESIVDKGYKVSVSMDGV